jgi:hypothetical protein
MNKILNLMCFIAFFQIHAKPVSIRATEVQ